MRQIFSGGLAVPVSNVAILTANPIHRKKVQTPADSLIPAGSRRKCELDRTPFRREGEDVRHCTLQLFHGGFVDRVGFAAIQGHGNSVGESEGLFRSIGRRFLRQPFRVTCSSAHPRR